MSPDPTPISAVKYSLDKLESRPIAATDNAVRGVFVYPFSNKWVGLDEWYPGLGTVLACLAITGLVAWLWWPEGRLLLVMFFGSLVPFSMTWTVLGGAEWRLTLFAYAFYLIAAFWVVDKAARLVRSSLVDRGATPWGLVTRHQILRVAATILALVIVAGVWSVAVPYALVREVYSHEGAATIVAGPRDRWFFVDGWSSLVVEGNVTMRIAVKPEAALRIPLPRRDRTRSPCGRIRLCPPWLRNRSCTSHSTGLASRISCLGGIPTASENIKSRSLPASSLLAISAWNCARTPPSNCGTCASSPNERAHCDDRVFVSTVRR